MKMNKQKLTKQDMYDLINFITESNKILINGMYRFIKVLLITIFITSFITTLSIVLFLILFLK